MVTSTGSPFLVFNRYFLSQMSAEAGCIGMPWAASGAVSFRTASRRTMLILLDSPCCRPRSPDPTTWGLSLPFPLHLVGRPNIDVTPAFGGCQPLPCNRMEGNKASAGKDLDL